MCVEGGRGVGCCWSGWCGGGEGVEVGGRNAAKSLFVWLAPAQRRDEGNRTVDEKKRKYMRPRHVPAQPLPDTTTLQPDNLLRWWLSFPGPLFGSCFSCDGPLFPLPFPS